MMRVPRPFVAGAALALCVIGPGWSPAQEPTRAAQPLKSGPLQVDADGAVYVVNPDSDSVTRLAPPNDGRAQAAPGTCDLALAADAARAGTLCHFDAECGAGSPASDSQA
jgi:hypothetical protein